MLEDVNVGVQELLLHPLVASSTSDTVVAEAAQQLDGQQAVALLRYLAAWLTHHSQLLAGWLHPAIASGSSSQKGPASAARDNSKTAASRCALHIVQGRRFSSSSDRHLRLLACLVRGQWLQL